MTSFTKKRLTHGVAIALSTLALTWSAGAQAHCDTLDGPVVSAARKALDSGNVNHALAWVQKGDEAEVRRVFDRARTVRKAGGQSQALADQHFFETVVRIHRAGEGAPYSGLKPAGTPDPSIAAADQAIAKGTLQNVATMIEHRVHSGLEQRFREVARTKAYDANDVAAGRNYVKAYVEYVHYVERLHEVSGHGAAASGEKAPAHAH
jgi:hypothetical protein